MVTSTLPMPPFSAALCASAIWLSGKRRPTGMRSLPSFTACASCSSSGAVFLNADGHDVDLGKVFAVRGFAEHGGEGTAGFDECEQLGCSVMTDGVGYGVVGRVLVHLAVVFKRDHVLHAEFFGGVHLNAAHTGDDFGAGIL